MNDFCIGDIVTTNAEAAARFSFPSRIWMEVVDVGTNIVSCRLINPGDYMHINYMISYDDTAEVLRWHQDYLRVVGVNKSVSEKNMDTFNDLLDTV